jgi:hypothetical protein
VLKSLNSTPDAWLVDLLKSFNAGQIKAFEDAKARKFNNEPQLAQNEDRLRTKILLLSLMEVSYC